MEEARGKEIASGGGIYNFPHEAWGKGFDAVVASHGSPLANLYNGYGCLFFKYSQGLFRILLSAEGGRLFLVGEYEIHVVSH